MNSITAATPLPHAPHLDGLTSGNTVFPGLPGRHVEPQACGKPYKLAHVNVFHSTCVPGNQSVFSPRPTSLHCREKGVLSPVVTCWEVYLFIWNKPFSSAQRTCRLMVIAAVLLAPVHLVHLLLLIKTKCAPHRWRADGRINPLPGDN